MQMSNGKLYLIFSLIMYLGLLWIGIIEVGAMRAKLDKELMEFGYLYNECKDTANEFRDDVRQFTYNVGMFDKHLDEIQKERTEYYERGRAGEGHYKRPIEYEDDFIRGLNQG